MPQDLRTQSSTHKTYNRTFVLKSEAELLNIIIELNCNLQHLLSKPCPKFCTSKIQVLHSNLTHDSTDLLRAPKDKQINKALFNLHA